MWGVTQQQTAAPPLSAAAQGPAWWPLRWGTAAAAHGVPGPLSGHRPQLGPVMLIETVRVLVGWSDAGPRPHLVKSYLSDTFQYRGETIKGATPPLPPLALPPLKVFIGHNSNFGRIQF